MPGATDALSMTNPVGIASEALGALEGGYQFVDNIIQHGKAKKALANLHDPYYKVQNEYYNNRNIAGDLAQGGMPAASKDYYTSEMQRGLGGGINGTLQAGGSPNDINKLFDTYGRSIDRTASEDASQRINNIQNYINTNTAVAGQKNIQFGFNEVRPYERKYKQYMQQMGSSEQNAYNGANTLIGSVGAAGTSMQNNYLLNNLFKDNSTPLNRTTRGASGIDNIPVNNPMANSTNFINPVTTIN